MVSVVGLIGSLAGCQTVEPEDEEEVGPTPSPGCPISTFQYDTRAAGQDEGGYSSRILSNPCLTARYYNKRN